MENNTIDCGNGLPTTQELYFGLTYAYKWILVMPTGFCLMTFTLYLINLCTIIKYGKKETKSNVLILLTLYPENFSSPNLIDIEDYILKNPIDGIVACSSLISIYMPRTFFFCDTIAHVAFVITSYQFYRYCINSIEGESKFIALSKDESFTLKTPPCCCCCLCLNSSMITKEKFLWIRILVLQLAIVHVIIFTILNIINIEYPDKLEDAMLYSTPFIVITILLAVWGFNIAVRMLVPYYVNLNLFKKFLAFQLVLVFCKFQPVLFNLIFRQFVTSCNGPITVVVKIRTITQIFIQFEMIILSLWSHFLYTSNYNL